MTEKSALRLAFSPQVIRQSLVVALIVGTLLSLINQGDILLEGQEVNYWKLMLTYLVPFFVATFGAWNMARVFN